MGHKANPRASSGARPPETLPMPGTQVEPQGDLLRPSAMELWSQATRGVAAKARGTQPTAQMPNLCRGYAYRRPGEIDRQLAASPIVYVPVGVPQWHGPGLPVGSDLILSQVLSLLSAERTGGLVWPALLCGFGGVKSGTRAFGPEFKDSTIQQYMSETIRHLDESGAKMAVVVCGNMSSGALAALRRAVAGRAENGMVTTLVSVPGLLAQIGLEAPAGGSLETAMVTWAGAWESGLSRPDEPRTLQKGRDVLFALRQAVVEEARRAWEKIGGES